MSPNEKIVKELADRVSRRDFLKMIGGFVGALSATLIGTVDTAKASACCPTPACGSCQFQGSQCPVGWTRIQITQCCLFGCSYTCSKCRKNSNPDMGSICWCTHEDFSECPGQNCVSAPQP